MTHEGVATNLDGAREGWRSALARAGAFALDAVLPPRCLGCGRVVETPGTLCAVCWEGVAFIVPPVCAACGVPFEIDPGPGALCAACAAARPAFARARAVFVYDDASRAMVIGFKHGDRTESAPAFAAWMARAGADLLAEAELIAPVPLHWTRLFARRYNQAALLAAALGHLSGRAVVADLLVRRRRTPSQGRLGVTARRRNVAGAFAVKAGRAPLARGRRVLVIDDVLTTGATAEACARALTRAGAGAVDVLTLARVVRPAFSEDALDLY